MELCEETICLMNKIIARLGEGKNILFMEE